tara:strand:- start:575 stop:1585 length:1011 start_codon:yes stop_codon:yes gene_type:complete
LTGTPGWTFIIVGFGLLLFGSVLDLTDNFEQLNRFFVVGDTPVQAVLEKLVGFLGGFVFVAVGLVLWIPQQIAGLEEAEQDLRESRGRFEDLVRAVREVIWEIDPAGRYVYLSDNAEEEALEESESRFRDLIEGSIQGIAIYDWGWKPLFANQAVADMFGYDSPEEILALENSAALLAPGERERMKRMSEARRAGHDVPRQYEFQGLCKDGTIRWFEHLIRPVVWAGEPAFQASTINIDLRKRAEEALRASQEEDRQRQAELAHAHPIPSWPFRWHSWPLPAKSKRYGWHTTPWRSGRMPSCVSGARGSLPRPPKRAFRYRGTPAWCRERAPGQAV